MSTTTVERTRGAGPGSGLGGNWRVIVRNDNHNTFEHVAQTLARVLPGVSLDQGHRIADRIHNSGQAIVWSGPARAGRALLAAARRGGPDDGPARARLSGAAAAGSVQVLRARAPRGPARARGPAREGRVTLVARPVVDGSAPGWRPGSAPPQSQDAQRVTRPSPTDRDPRLRGACRAPPSEPRAAPAGACEETKRPSSRKAPAPQIAWFLCPPTAGQRNHDPRPGTAPPIPWFLCPTPTDKGTTTLGPLGNPGPSGALEGREPWSLGSFRETGAMAPRELRPRKPARGALGGACRGREARGRSRWEGWGVPLNVMRLRRGAPPGASPERPLRRQVE